MAQNRWTINPEGGITWTIDQRLPHEDHIEMSGQKVSTVLRYGVDANGSFILISAKADSGVKFVKWTKDGKDFSTEAEIKVPADEDSEYVAVFE